MRLILMTVHSLLAPFDALVLQHQEQFTPPLEQLRTTVETTLQQLHAQEQSLVAAQMQALSDVRSQLATDARVLMGSIELDRFIVEVQRSPAPQRWNQTAPVPQINRCSAEWQLAQTQLAVAVSDYVSTVNHDDYDDERTHSSYRYAITLHLQGQSRSIQALTQRIYSPIEQRVYDVRSQLAYEVESGVTNLVQPLTIEEAIKPQLIAELSYLVGCAARLLSLVPHSVQFHYPIHEAGV